MRLTIVFAAIPLCAVVWAASQPWIDKPAAQWSDAEARLVINDSPWAKRVTTQYEGTGSGGGGGARSRVSFPGGGGGGGRRGGMGGGGYPGGGGGYPGGGYPGGGGGYPGGGGGYPGGGGGYPGGGGGYPGGGGRSGGGGNFPTGGGQSAPPEAAPAVTLRWESALPVREAELKGGVTDAPDVDEADYVLAVYGLPKWVVSGNPDDVALALKKEGGILRREGKKDVKATRVRVLDRDSGPIVVYIFPRSKEITRNDGEVEFTAKIGQLRVTQFFALADMFYQGKLEL